MRPLAHTLRTAALLLTLLAAHPAAGQQSDRIREQKRVIEALEKKIAAEERQIADFKKGRTASEAQVRRLARQIESRSRLIDEKEKQAELLRAEIARKDSLSGSLAATLGHIREQYAAMTRAAYRNYRHNNYLTYLFASRDFNDAARRLASLREAAALRRRRIEQIDSLSEEVRIQRTELDERKHSLDSVKRSLAAQRKRLQNDASAARASVKQLSQKEREALRRKVAQEQQLSVAIGELRKLTKGNTAGASFSSKTSGLHLPVVGGRVKRYKGNMAEVTGPRGAKVISIYEGKVIEIKRNRITEKYDVYIAHGDYVSSYAHMGAICVEKGQKVARNQQIGTIGSAVNPLTMESEYKLVFGIYPPKAGIELRAENCFRK